MGSGQCHWARERCGGTGREQGLGRVWGASRGRGEEEEQRGGGRLRLQPGQRHRGAGLSPRTGCAQGRGRGWAPGAGGPRLSSGRGGL